MNLSYECACVVVILMFRIQSYIQSSLILFSPFYEKKQRLLLKVKM